jgi:four helix bundle protein
MAAVQSFRELVVWQRAIELAVAAYKLSAAFPREEAYGLTAQIRRASVAVASHIAEGQGRATTSEFRHFLGNARGSNSEVQTHLVLARELGLGEAEGLQRCEEISVEVGKMLNGLMRNL